MTVLRFATLGTGFWARFQLSAWREVGGAECVALYNRTRSKAETLGQEMGIDAIYDDAEELLRRERLDFVDIITDPGTHEHFVTLAAGRVPSIICQTWLPRVSSSSFLVGGSSFELEKRSEIDLRNGFKTSAYSIRTRPESKTSQLTISLRTGVQARAWSRFKDGGCFFLLNNPIIVFQYLLNSRFNGFSASNTIPQNAVMVRKMNETGSLVRFISADLTPKVHRQGWNMVIGKGSLINFGLESRRG